MNLHQIQEKLKALRQIRLLPEEKAELRSVLIRTMSENPAARPAVFWSMRIRFQRVALASLSVMVVFSGAVTAAAAQSLPGEYLYPFKINVSENVARLFVAPSTRATARYETKLVEKRLIEIEELLNQEELSETEKEVVRSEISSQANRAANAIEKSRPAAREKEPDEQKPSEKNDGGEAAEEVKETEKSDGQKNDNEERETPKKKDKDAPDLDAIFEKHRETIERINYQPARAAERGESKK